MKCLKCEGDLVLVRVGEVEVDQCDTCSGIWFDSGELAKILGKKDVEALRTRAEETSAASQRMRTADQKRARCPRCKGEGNLVQIASLNADLHIDTCAVCGGEWLDGGELATLRNEGFTRKIGAFFRKILEM
ncbi:MAG: zf-TFIIB domain-containing protein [Polyangiaceae bacterium]